MVGIKDLVQIKYATGLLVFAFACSFASSAWSVEKTATWTHPTQRTDNTALPVSEIIRTEVYCDNVLVGTAPAPDTTLNIDLSEGSHTCYGITYAVGNNGNAELASAESELVTIVIPVTLLPPKPPSGFGFF